jgi:hypothetical protein
VITGSSLLECNGRLGDLFGHAGFGGIHDGRPV